MSQPKQTVQFISIRVSTVLLQFCFQIDQHKDSQPPLGPFETMVCHDTSWWTKNPMASPFAEHSADWGGRGLTCPVVSGGVRWRWLKMFKDVWRPVSETEFSHQVYTNSSPSPCLAASSSPCLSADLFFLQGNHRWRASGVVKIKTGPKIRVYFSNYLLGYFSTISWVIGTQFWPIRCTAADQPASQSWHSSGSRRSHWTQNQNQKKTLW